MAFNEFKVVTIIICADAPRIPLRSVILFLLDGIRLLEDKVVYLALP